jgi:hypothetical protein
VRKTNLPFILMSEIADALWAGLPTRAASHSYAATAANREAVAAVAKAGLSLAVRCTKTGWMSWQRPKSWAMPA